ncbi:hypothetical protein [Pseudonocardia sp.]|uniref:hypothetical protein n=1 Tax=Pseudonocardia sp. TaxID=60912 RepID=UPI003D0FB702
MTEPATDPIREYKAITAAVTDAVDALRDRDLARAAELTHLLSTLDAAMARVGDRVALSRAGVELLWEAALEMLWSESWMTLRPMPWPEPAGPATGLRKALDLDALDAEVAARFAELADAVRRRGLSLRR